MNYPNLMLWLALFPFVFAPVCALGAGVITWAMTRRQRPEDGELLRHFLVVMGLLLMASYAASNTDAVKERLNPQIKAKRDLFTMPVHAAMREHLPFDWAPVEQKLDEALAAGVPAERISALLRSQYLAALRRQLPFSTGAAVQGYAQALLPALQELQPSHPELCVQLAWARAPGAPFDLRAYVSVPAAAAHENAIAQVIAQSELAVTRDRSKPHETGDAGSLEDTQRAYAGIREAMEPRYGAAVSMLHTRAVAQLQPAAACDATIELLSRTLQQPQGIARSLLRNMLRD